MSVLISYITVVLIWATTPLAITLSSDSVSTQAAILLRMLLAAILMAFLVSLWQHGACLKRRNMPVYIAASIALFPNMALVYQASSCISSGMIAVLFSLTPIISGVLAAFVLDERKFTPRRVFAVLLALSGLVIVFVDQLTVAGTAWVGVVFMLASAAIFSISQVSVKYLQRHQPVDASEQTLGALVFSLPGLFASWLYFDGKLPAAVSKTSLYAIVYLAVVGSVLGFIAYYFILSKLSVTLVSLIPMITPVLALWLGVLLLDESVSQRLMAGSGIIVFALLLYQQWQPVRLKRARREVKAGKAGKACTSRL